MSLFDPRLRVLITIVGIIGIVITPDDAFPAYPLLWAFVGSLATLSQINLWTLAKRAGVVLPFALAALTLLFTVPGKPLFTLVGLTVTEQGLIRFIGVLLKSWLAAQMTLLFAMTTPFNELLWALGQLRVPAPLVAIIGFMYRYLFVLQEEADQMLRARAARSAGLVGQKTGGNIWWRARVAGGMVGSLFLRSYERSERVYAAMLARGYQGHLQRPEANPLPYAEVMKGVIPLMILLGIQLMARWWA